VLTIDGVHADVKYWAAGIGLPEDALLS
jgi:hypothetical protein